MNSMTGFGQASDADRSFSIDVTARSYNHKFLDLSVRLRDEYLVLEPKIRSLIKSRLARGRVELSVDIQPAGGRRSQVEVDRHLIASLERVARQLSAAGMVASHLTIADLIRLPGAVTVKERSGEVDVELVATTVTAALERLEETRSREGAELEKICRQCKAELSAVLDRLTERRATVVASVQDRLVDRIEELDSEVALDPQRLHQEVAVLIDRSDIREELDRLGVHCEELDRLIESQDPIGKRLGFLCQEILRELNTVASKSRDSELTAAVLDGKLICDQIREQALNVE